MRSTFTAAILTLSLWASAAADIVIYNTVNEAMTYEFVLSNGDTKKGDILPNTGYGPQQSRLEVGDAKRTSFKVFNEEGKPVAQVSSPDERVFVLFQDGDSIKIDRVSWFRDNGQKHRRAFGLLNATEEPLYLDIIDAKTIRKDIVLKPGEKREFEAKNGFDGSSGWHHIRFKDNNGSELFRKDRAVGAGYFHVVFKKKGDNPNVFSVKDYGWLTPPRGYKD